MKSKDFEWLTDEFMLYCRSTQLREKTMSSYEQTLHLFGRWLADELKIYTVDKVTENVIRRYIDDLMVRGKYTFYVNDLSMNQNRRNTEVLFIKAFFHPWMNLGCFLPEDIKNEAAGELNAPLRHREYKELLMRKIKTRATTAGNSSQPK